MHLNDKTPIVNPRRNNTRIYFGIVAECES